MFTLDIFGTVRFSFLTNTLRKLEASKRISSFWSRRWFYKKDTKNRYACISDRPIKESEHKFLWPEGLRPDDHTSLIALGLRK